MKQIPACKKFNGYKPCYPDHDCWTDGCKEMVAIGKKILIINLDALGDVIMTTAQLPAIKRKFPESTIYWVTLKLAVPLLQNNPYLDQIFPYDFESISILQQMEFDLVLSSDKSQRSCALANLVKAEKKCGFGLNTNGKIIPLNEGAYYNYKLGMDDQLKFKVNQKTGQEYLAETFELDYGRDDYIFEFTDEEKKFIADYKKSIHLTPKDKVIGFNTGCSLLFPNKKMTVEQHIALITSFLKYKTFKIALFGGPEDEERNAAIKNHFGDAIMSTPTSIGIRKGACFMDIADVIITGDSFGMHMSIALKKYVIAWFGMSCWTEIDLYGRGIKLFHEELACSPCWKKVCPFDLECITMIDLKKIEEDTLQYLTGLSK